MTESDLVEFTEIMDELRSDYGKKPLSTLMTKIDFESLRPYSLNQVKRAIIKHRSNPEKSGYCSNPGHLIEYLEGASITADYIVAAARLAETPLGVLARIHIGTHDLNNLNAFDLKQRAAECLQLLPNWKSRAMAGEYRDHEISMMVKHNVNPAQPFAMGIAGPQNAPELISRVQEVSATDRHKELLEPHHRAEITNSESVSEDGIKRIKQELKGL